MRNLILVIAVFMVSVTSFAQNDEMNPIKLSNEPFIISFENLSKYLSLSSTQLNEVYEINNYFIETQKNCLNLNASLQEKKMKQTVYGNLKLMKNVLYPEQYKKYITLLNITNSNRMMDDAEPDIYLTDNNCE